MRQNQMTSADKRSSVRAATLVDTVGSAALATVQLRTSVSTTLSCTYLLGIQVGDTALVDATALSNGNRLSTVEVRTTQVLVTAA